MSKNIQNNLGCLRDKKDRRDFRLVGIQKPVRLPEKFELFEKFNPNNQFSRPSCTSQAQAHHKEKQEGEEMSARFIMAKTKEIEGNTNWGAYTRNTFKVVQKYGVCPEGYFREPEASMSWEEYIDTKNIPEHVYKQAEKHKSKSYWRIDIEPGYTKGWEEIKQAIFQYKNSVVVSMPWYKNYYPDQDGILPKGKEYIGGHAIEIVGWDKDLFKAKNSWGENWGPMNGYFFIAEGRHKIWDAWVSLDLEERYPVDDYYNYPRRWVDYLKELKVVTNPWLWAKIKRAPSPKEVTALRFYWPYEAVFEGKYGNKWLYLTFPEYLKQYEKQSQK
ncbi:MAG: C1 family peptidase [bacterium]